MLELTEADFGTDIPGVRSGVTAWWLRLPKRKTPALALAWYDLVLLRPRVSWPLGSEPAQGETTRVTYVPGLACYVFSEGVQVPWLPPVLELKRGDLERLRVTKHKITHGTKLKRLVLRCLERADGSAVYLRQRTLVRIAQAVEQPELDLDVRLTPARIGAAVTVWVDRCLRAIASVLDEATALGIQA